jgi:WD40 repeat protein
MLRCIGSGSYGEVWLARNVMAAYRAVKVINRQTFSDERPYEREFHGMQKFEPVSRSHDGLVDILQVGRNDAAGCFYYVMELGDDVVSGQTIDSGTYDPKTLGKEAARRGRLPLDECLQLGLSLSAALNHLHKHGLIHRDIKPSNIIFVNGIPKIADIGLVAEVGMSKTFVGTEGFIPPEGPGTVQADIYSLGKVLYEISSGKDRQTFPELPTQLDEREDQRDYLELNEVVLKACESDPHKRYKSAEEMRADLLLLQAGKSVKRLRLLERRLALLSKIGIVTAILLLVGAVAYYQVNRDRRIAKQSLAASHVAYGTRLMDEGDLLAALPSFAEALRLEEGDREREKRHRVHLGVLLRQCPKLTRMWFLDGRVNDVQFSPDGRRLVVAGIQGSVVVWDINSGSQAFGLVGHDRTKEVEAVSYSRDGHLIATASEDGTMRIWNAETGQEFDSTSTHLHPDAVLIAKFAPQDDRILTACKDGRVRIWKVREREPFRQFLAHPHGVKCASFSPDGRWIVTSSYDGSAKIWDAETGEQKGATMKHDDWVYQASFSPDGRHIVTASYDKTARIWDAETGKLLTTFHPDAPVRSAEFSPDGRYVVTVCWDYEFNTRIWDLTREKEAFPPLKHTSYPTHASFSPQGHHIVTSGANGVICLWDLAGNSWIAPSVPVFYSRDGNVFATITHNAVHVSDATATNAPSRDIVLSGQVHDIIFDRDGKRLMTISIQRAEAGTISKVAQLWDVSTGKSNGPPFSYGHSTVEASLSDGGQRLVTIDGNTVQVWDAAKGKPLFSLKHSFKVSEALFNPDTTRLVTTSEKNAYLWDAITGKDICVFEHVSKAGHTEFSPNGRYLVTCCSEGSLAKRYAQLWDGRTGKKIGGAFWHNDGVIWASFSPQSDRIVTASEDRSAMIWDTTTGRKLTRPLVHNDHVLQASFSPDGRWVATCCADDTVRLWDAATGTPITPRLHHSFPLRHVQFIANGSRIIAKRLKGENWMNWEALDNPKPVEWRMWELNQDARPVSELMLMGHLLSGHEYSDQIGVPLEKEALQFAWQKLSALHASDFTVSQNENVAWHQREAEASEKAGQWSAAVFHWDHLIRTTPGEQVFRDRRTTAQRRLDSDRTTHIK